ncbi:MAG: hypothetical protein ACP5JG_05120 [Anaerolineae bacterium]
MKDTRTRRILRMLFRLMSYRAPAVDVPAQGVVLDGVTVVSPGQARRADQTLVVEGDRIAELHSGDGERVAGSDRRYAGCVVLPGLIDMHVHIPPPRSVSL